MSAPSFDATHAVRFDLPRGSVRAGGEGGEPVLLVPTQALHDLVRAAPSEAAEALGRALGAAIGKRVAAKVEAGAQIEAFVTQLAGESAVGGAGVVSVERWGRALVVVIEGSPLSEALLAPFVAGALDAASGRRVATTLLSMEGSVARILVASERGVERVRADVAKGTAWAEALAKLQGEGT